MQRVLITGGAGFIGSHLVDECLRLGFDVTVIDNLSVGRLRNIEAHMKNGNFHFIEADVSKFERIEPYFKEINWVFHLAARADIVPSIQLPHVYHQANVEGTVAVLEAARKWDVDRFVYAASSSCYGIPDVYPTPENAAIRPEYPYALTKYVGECYVMHWEKVYKLPALSLRFFNVYGPRARTSGTYGAVFGVFLSQKLAGKPLTVVGDGTQTRDFTYVSDIVQALISAAKSPLSGEIFNVGSGGTYSVNHLVELLNSPAVSIPKRPGEPDQTFADISKIQKELGWEPKVSFEQGVKTLLAKIEDWKDAPVWTPEAIEKATADWFKFLS
ncbi:MAG: SDR family oxidoreductase [Bdellovibrionaceae bacterium]|nr:SDR family oxidoreductase [Bdellovibrionales bacterium]MCB9254624.1 SDR family oxidoreductase [Pseudobdellovibrionaceae bacterium]